MAEALRLAFKAVDPTFGSASLLPFAPVILSLGGQSTSVEALVDSGAALNVLPYEIGIRLGAKWNEQNVRVKLAGNMSDSEARAILVTTTIGEFAPVRLAFAWSSRDDIPVILGQVNFFMEFDICFFRRQLEFEIRPSRNRPN